jgi:hypothetical protein
MLFGHRRLDLLDLTDLRREERELVIHVRSGRPQVNLLYSWHFSSFLSARSQSKKSLDVLMTVGSPHRDSPNEGLRQN